MTDQALDQETSLDPPSRKQTRPWSVTLVALLQILQGLGLLGAGFYQVHAHGWSLGAKLAGWRYIPLPLFETLSSGLILIGLGGLLIVFAFALLALKNWAWLVCMTLQGLGLLFGLIGYMRHRPNYVGMVLGILLVFAMNLQEVQRAFNQKIEV